MIKKIIVISIALFINHLTLYCQYSLNEDVLPDAFLLEFQKNYNIYSDCTKNKIVDIISNDSIKENYCHITLIEKCNKLFHINYLFPQYDSVIKTGWIDSNSLGTFLKPKSKKLIFYQLPDTNSKQTKLNINYDIEGVIIDVKDDWLKVLFKYKKRFFIGWFSRKYTDGNVYGSCG